MARGAARVPSQNAYKGALGRTQTETVHVTGPHGEMQMAAVYTTIDAVSDPELADRLHEPDSARALNVVRFDGAEPVRIDVPVVYHDPAVEVFALVLSNAHRHRELEERIAVYERLLEDDAAIPTYVKELAVVWGPAGLRSYLEERAGQALEAERLRMEHDKRIRDLERQRLELEVVKADVAKQRAEIEHQRVELARDRAELERLRSEARSRAIAAAQAAHQELATRPISRQELADIVTTTPPVQAKGVNGRSVEPPPAAVEDFESGMETGIVDALDVAKVESDPYESVPFERGDDVEADDETTGSSVPPVPSLELPAGSDPLTTECHELSTDGALDAWLANAAKQPQPSFEVTETGVRLALVTGEAIARSFGPPGSPIDVRVILRRAPTYPVVALVFGSPAALRTPHVAQLATVVLDVASERDRAVLQALARRFELGVEVIVRGRRSRRVRLVAPLADNIAYIVRAADDHLRGVATEDEASLDRARELVLSNGYDLLGVDQPDNAEFRDDRLSQLDTAQQLRRAVAMARRFARPSREDYLVCTRGYPLARWRQLRRAVVDKAVAWGIWMGPELAQVAVSEGLARSRRDLVVRLDRGFEALRQDEAAFDIDAEAAEDNANALAEEARALGVELAKTRNGAIASDEVSSVSGSIGGTPSGIKKRESIDELMAQLDDKQTRMSAALELCERADGRAAAKVIQSVQKMSRAEAVRVLGMAVKLGDAAKQPLVEGLASSKSFLRHGCALALALLRTEDGTQAVIELLLSEPTEIWREVARAIGQVGPSALLPLAATYGRLGERANASTAERVAWAMAHIAVRGGKAAVEAMARGESVVAPVARQALQLHGSAANDHVRVRPGGGGSQAGRDVTVNRAFSRRFFEALEAGIPDAGQAGLVDLDASGPMELLDEADLIDDEDAESELDESDLIQS